MWTRTTQAWRAFPPRGRPTSGTPSSTARGWKTASAPRVEAAPQAPLGHPTQTPASWGTLRVPRSRSSWKRLNSTRPSWAVSYAATLKVTPSRRGRRSTRRRCSGRSRRTGPLPPRPAPAWGPPLASPALLLAHVQAVSAGWSRPALGAGKLLAPSPPPGLGVQLGQGEVSWNRNSRPGSSITPGCPSGFKGVSWKGELRHLSARRAH